MGGRAVIREAEAQSMLPGTEHLLTVHVSIFSRQRGEADGARPSCSVRSTCAYYYLPRHS